jgi:hypothetical protein
MKLAAIALGLVLGMWGLATESTKAQAQAQPAKRLALTGQAISTGGFRSDATFTPVDILFERWSTDADRDRLIEALKQGPKGALEVLQKFRRVGSMSVPGNLGIEIYFVTSVPTPDGGRQILAITDREQDFAEAFFQTQSSQYPFSVLELKLDAKNQGSGKFHDTAQLVYMGKSGFMAENFAGPAIDIKNVRPR